MKKLKNLVSVIVLLFPLSVLSFPNEREVSLENPLSSELPNMVYIYNDSCLASSTKKSFLSKHFPTMKMDNLIDDYHKEYKNLSNNAINLLVYAGFTSGEAIDLTDRTEEFKEAICQNYALNFSVSVINNIFPIKKNKQSHYIKQDVVYSNSNLPFNDIFEPKVFPKIDISTSNAYIAGCQLIYMTLAKQPVIQVTPLDVSIELMTDMIYHNYSKSNIKNVYPTILQGAKFGQLIFYNKQSIGFCND